MPEVASAGHGVRRVDGLPENEPGRLCFMRDAGGCFGKTTAIEGATLPASGTYTWTGRALNPVAGTRPYEFTLEECSTALLSIP